MSHCSSRMGITDHVQARSPGPSGVLIGFLVSKSALGGNYDADIHRNVIGPHPFNDPFLGTQQFDLQVNRHALNFVQTVPPLANLPTRLLAPVKGPASCRTVLPCRLRQGRSCCFGARQVAAPSFPRAMSPGHLGNTGSPRAIASRDRVSTVVLNLRPRPASFR